MNRVHVLVVEDSLTIRKHLVALLDADPGLVVVGEAANGRDAISLTRQLRPDVITLDIVLPGMNGLDVTEEIMAYQPTPILIVSAADNRGEQFDTFDALAAGAVDVLDKPRGDALDAAWERRFVQNVKMVARIKVIMHPRAKLKSYQPLMPPLEVRLPQPDLPGREVVAIGASTGGPGALASLLRSLPATFPLPILLVIHIDPNFADSFVEWLNGLSSLPVSLATPNSALPAPGRGQVIMAPPGMHLIVRNGRLHLVSEPRDLPFCPAVDVLFESLAREKNLKSIACLLTGMGRDGAAGLLALRQAGAMTVAQDEATSIVFGMPKAAIDLGAAREILPLPVIGPWLCRMAERDRHLRRQA